jgi:two-component sensor histidine kinase
MAIDLLRSPGTGEPADRLHRLLRWGLPPASLRAFAFALFCVAVALAVRLIFWLFRPDLVVFATYYPAVLAATLIGGWQAGILAQVAGGFVAWLYFDPSLLPPTQSLDEQMVAFSLYGLSSGVIVWAAEQYRHVVRRLDEEQQHRRLIVDELRHRLRNKLAVVQAVLSHELRAHEDVRAKIGDRLKALAHADELLLRQDHEMVDLHAILRVELSLYGDACVALKGEPVELPPKLAAALTLVFHELATNAAKYGALKLPEGRVSIGWRLESGSLAIEWTESGGPPVTAPRRSGFGTALFRRSLDPFHGIIATRFEPAGLRCEIQLEIPAAGPAGARGAAVEPGAVPVMNIGAARDKAAHAQLPPCPPVVAWGGSEARQERVMSEAKVPSNPSDDYPPTRPGGLLVAITVLLIFAVVGIENWSDVSKEVPRIKAALHL